jgi:hypothetical protein
MTDKRKPRRGHAGAQNTALGNHQHASYSRSRPTGKARTLHALKRSLARATEPALRERLAAAVASLERGRP